MKQVALKDFLGFASMCNVQRGLTLLLLLFTFVTAQIFAQYHLHVDGDVKSCVVCFHGDDPATGDALPASVFVYVSAVVVIAVLSGVALPSSHTHYLTRGPPRN